MATRPMDEKQLLATYGAWYWERGQRDVYKASDDNLYFYETYIGEHAVIVERGDSMFAVSKDEKEVMRLRGPCTYDSAHFAVVIRGYMGDEIRRRIDQSRTNLPYVNGCSTKQLIPPERAGDPTFQQLIIPPYSKEQAHHIHSTVRAVYILAGKGKSIVGIDDTAAETELLPGMTCVLEPMCPHHFETPQGEPLTCLPVHVFSSTPMEFSHPMFAGTHLMNQGE